jgi:hypothetical protein
LRATQLSYSRGWTSQNNTAVFGGVDASTKTSGSKVTRTGIHAHSLSLVATECATCGVIQARWNGAVVRTVSLHRSTTVRKQLIPLAVFVGSQSGTLTITDVGSSGQLVMVEGLAVYNP